MTETTEAMARRCRGLDGKGYGAYKSLRGIRWDVAGATAEIETVQADPYAPPSRVVVRVPPDVAGLPADVRANAERRRGLADALLRALRAELPTGRSGAFAVDAGAQAVLQRSAGHVAADGAVTVHLAVSLPAAGRTIRGLEAADLLAEALPDAVDAALRWPTADQARLRSFCDAVEDAVALRGQLADAGLVAFVADGAVLPRASGVDDRPMAHAVAFASPPSLQVTLDAPNAGAVTGMGVPEGVTLIVGGGYHGKSTLLRTLERGVFDHIPGDGRERCVTREDAVKVRAADGRRVTRVDVSAFVGGLPTGDDTTDFTTDDASGSTSQAATTAEAVEAGAGVLLIDEDTAATNLMIRDARMQQLVAEADEPLTPFCDVVGSLHRDHGVSTVLVVGGSGDYFDVADTVVRLVAFRASEVTADARKIAESMPGRRPAAAVFPSPAHRVPDGESVPLRLKGKVKTQARGTHAVQLAREHVDLSDVEQLVDPSQTAGIAQAVVALVDEGWLDGQRTLAQALAGFEAWVAEHGAAGLRGHWPGDLAVPRRHEVAAALNRLRTLVVIAQQPAQ